MTSVRAELVAVVMVSLTWTVTLCMCQLTERWLSIAMRPIPTAMAQTGSRTRATRCKGRGLLRLSPSIPHCMQLPASPADQTCGTDLQRRIDRDLVIVPMADVRQHRSRCRSAVTGNENVPDAPGVPLMVPSGLSDKPLGGVPTAHIYGGVPPLTTVCEYWGL